MKKLSLLLLFLLCVRCGNDPTCEMKSKTKELIETTDQLNSMSRENKGLRDDILKNQRAVRDLMDLSVASKDDLAKTILVERISELMKVGDAKAQKLRNNNDAIMECRVRVDRIITSMKYARSNKVDTTRNILSIDSVQQVN